MGKGKKPAPGPASGSHAKERHKRDRRGGRYLDPSAPVPPDLVVRRERPQISSKHKSWFEFIENKDKKKKLEIEVLSRVSLSRWTLSRTDLNPVHHQRGAAAGLRVRAHRKSGSDQGVQRALSRERRHDLHRHGLSTYASSLSRLLTSSCPRMALESLNTSVATWTALVITFANPSSRKHAQRSAKTS